MMNRIGNSPGYVVIDRATVEWAQSVLSRVVRGEWVSPLELGDVIPRMEKYDPLDVIEEEMRECFA